VTNGIVAIKSENSGQSILTDPETLLPVKEKIVHQSVRLVRERNAFLFIPPKAKNESIAVTDPCCDAVTGKAQDETLFASERSSGFESPGTGHELDESLAIAGKHRAIGQSGQCFYVEVRVGNICRSEKSRLDECKAIVRTDPERIVFTE
jgi:hypothetical protein